VVVVVVLFLSVAAALAAAATASVGTIGSYGGIVRRHPPGSRTIFAAAATAAGMLLASLYGGRTRLSRPMMTTAALTMGGGLLPILGMIVATIIPLRFVSMMFSVSRMLAWVRSILTSTVMFPPPLGGFLRPFLFARTSCWHDGLVVGSGSAAAVVLCRAPIVVRGDSRSRSSLIRQEEGQILRWSAVLHTRQDTGIFQQNLLDLQPINHLVDYERRIGRPGHKHLVLINILHLKRWWRGRFHQGRTAIGMNAVERIPFRGFDIDTVIVTATAAAPHAGRAIVKRTLIRHARIVLGGCSPNITNGCGTIVAGDAAPRGDMGRTDRSQMEGTLIDHSNIPTTGRRS